MSKSFSAFSVFGNRQVKTQAGDDDDGDHGDSEKRQKMKGNERKLMHLVQ